MIDPSLVEVLAELGYFEPDEYDVRILPDGREGVVIPLTFGRARLHVGQRGSVTYDDGW